VKAHEKSGACGTCGREEKCVLRFGGNWGIWTFSSSSQNGSIKKHKFHAVTNLDNASQITQFQPWSELPVTPKYNFKKGPHCHKTMNP
jgi:hypothetical protein